MRRVVQRLTIFLSCAMAVVASHGQQTVIRTGSQSVAIGPASPAAASFFSANHKYRLVLDTSSPTTAMNLIGTISKVDAGKETNLWARTFWNRTLQMIRPEDVLVSDDGDFFVLVSRGGWDAALYREHLEKELTHGDQQQQESLFISEPEGFGQLDRINGQTVIGIWMRDRNRWEGFAPADGSKITVPAEVTKRWDSEARERVIAKINNAKRDALRRKAGGFSRTLGKLASAAMSTNAVSPLREIDYEFLTALHVPEDRRILLERLNSEEPSFVQGSSQMWAQFNDDFAGYRIDDIDLNRAHADWLLAVWDGKATADMRPVRRGNVEDAPRFFLGAVEGCIRFPFPINLRSPVAEVRLRLVRGKSGEQGDNSGRAMYGSEPIEEAKFRFRTITPGTYRLKAVWDRRAPLNNTNSAGPGDYESAFSMPFVIRAGSTVSNVVLFCTNRAAGADNYYAADDSLAAKWRAGWSTAYSLNPDPTGRFDRFTRLAADWICATNVWPASGAPIVERLGLRDNKDRGGRLRVAARISRHVSQMAAP
jgi:hypothetical protein